MTLDAVAARTPDGRTLFENLNLAVGRERLGLVGRNGVGKTTLLDLIAGERAPCEGVVSRAVSVARLKQEPSVTPGASVAERLGVAAPRAVLDRILTGRGGEADLAEADWTLDERLEAALSDVGLAGLDLDGAAERLSGGERTRLGLAALSLAAPDLVLLDEPTNHLDAEGRALAADWLARWPGGAVVVSHDRDLLRRMDRIVELSSLGVAAYGGGYDLYAERKAQERAAAAQGLAAAERDLARVERDGRKARERQARRDAAGRRFAASGSLPRIALGLRADRAEDTAGRGRALAEARREMARDTLAAARERVERVRRMTLPMPPTGLAEGRLVMRLEAATVQAGGRVLAGPLDLVLTGPERLAVIGPNGSGKTSLLKLMAGIVDPASGRVERPVPGVLLDQHAALLRPEETLVGAYARLNPGATPNMAQAALARFLFRNAEAHRTVRSLSGGERLRAALACVMAGARPPQLLLLDEPTNHLDLEALEAVESALSAYDGALVVVSHDRDFLHAIRVTRELQPDPPH